MTKYYISGYNKITDELGYTSELTREAFYEFCHFNDTEPDICDSTYEALKLEKAIIILTDFDYFIERVPS